MASPNIKVCDISMPVLQNSTSHRVIDALPPQPDTYISDEDDEPLPAPPAELLFPYDESISDNTMDTNVSVVNSLQTEYQSSEHIQIDSTDHKNEILLRTQQDAEGVQKLQSKYASPDNIMAPRDPSSTNSDPNTTVVNNLTNNLSTQLSIRDSKELPPHLLNNQSNPNTGTGSVSAFSDASSDISDATTSAPSAASSGSNSVPPTSTIPVLEGATETDIQQVDMFYRSQKTDVRVCKSLANMYLSSTKTLDRIPVGEAPGTNGHPQIIKCPNPSQMSMDDWDFIKTGIPVLLLNTGEHLRERKLNIILAEKGTGFTLWEDELNIKTQYGTPHANFHTLSLSTDPSRLVGFSFDEASAATEFADSLKTLLPKPEIDVNSNDKKKKKKVKEKKSVKQKYKPPKKIDISGPCCFVHVTKLEPGVMGLISPPVFPPPPSGEKLTQEMLRSRSQSSELSDYSTSPSEHSCKS